MWTLSHNHWFFAEKMSLATGKHTFLVLSSKKTKKEHSSHQLSGLDQKEGTEWEGLDARFAERLVRGAAPMSL
jgi:hypothetical protein